jgi:Fe-S-cluster containining protein
MPNVRLPIYADRHLTTLKGERDQTTRDTYQEWARGGFQPSCSKGCSSCCYRPIYLAIPEAFLLVRYLKDHSLWSSALKTSLKEHARGQWGLDPAVYFLTRTPCPFLNEAEGLCRVYAARPLVCRVHGVKSDPYLCDPHHFTAAIQTLPKERALLSWSAAQSTAGDALGLGSETFHLPFSMALLLAGEVLDGDIPLETLGRKAWLWLTKGID